MALNQFGKPDSGRANGPQSLGPNLLKAALVKINRDGSILDTAFSSVGAFLLNPSTWEETKSTVWVPQSIPGQSDPVYQWSHGGPRVVTFTALVTKDTSYLNIPKQQASFRFDVSQSAVKTALGFIGAALAKVNPSTAAPPGPPPNITGILSIADYLNYYRSCLYPQYDNDTNPRRLKASPPLLVLLSGDTFNKAVVHNKIDTSSEVWMLTNLNIRITKQLPNLSPMEAEVEFQLTQYNIRSKGEGNLTSYSRI